MYTSIPALDWSKPTSNLPLLVIDGPFLTDCLIACGCRGNRTAFEIGLLCSAVAYAIMGLSAFGGARQQAIVYFAGLFTLRTLPGACPMASRAMIVKQGINTTSAGRGELNGSYGGLGTIIGVV